MTFLTPDNLLLSEVKNCHSADGNARAINCTTGDLPLPQHVADLVRDSIAGNTRKAYALDLARFEAWGGTLPASDRMVARYIADHAATHAPTTLSRWLVSLGKAHRAAEFADPCCSELVKASLRGAYRTSERRPAPAKALLRDDLFMALDIMGARLKDARDRALLLIGFAGAFRRSELVGLNLDDIEHVRHGIIVNLRRSKTDQLGHGRRIGIPLGRTRHCPVIALSDWIVRSGLDQGPMFRPIDRHGRIAHQRLSNEAVSCIIKQRLQAAAIDPEGYSGHSLRAGFATSAAMAGATTSKIRAQTGHKSDAMLGRYVRDGSLFIDNAANALL